MCFNALVKTTKNERQVTNFSVAINDSYKTKGSDQVTKIVTYVECAYWGSTSLATLLTKGTIVELNGRIGVSAYLNMQGEAKASLRFHVNSIKLHGGSKAAVKPAPINAAAITEPQDDLPF